MMLDASEALSRNSDPAGLTTAFGVPPGHTAVQDGVVGGVSVQKSKGEISEEAIRDALSRILESLIFAKSRRLSRFLRFTVEATLAGEEEMLKESLIATEVYERKPSHHPGEDSIVRTEAHRLRGKLRNTTNPLARTIQSLSAFGRAAMYRSFGSDTGSAGTVL